MRPFPTSRPVAVTNANQYPPSAAHQTVLTYPLSDFELLPDFEPDIDDGLAGVAILNKRAFQKRGSLDGSRVRRYPLAVRVAKE